MSASLTSLDCPTSRERAGPSEPVEDAFRGSDVLNCDNSSSRPPTVHQVVLSSHLQSAPVPGSAHRRRPAVTGADTGSSLVMKGSPVRVRASALAKSLQTAGF